MTSCLKHFPGYGNNTNNQKDLIYDETRLNSFRKSDFRPFKSERLNGVPMIMINHLVLGHNSS